MLPIFSGLFKFFYLHPGSYLLEFECFFKCNYWKNRHYFRMFPIVFFKKIIILTVKGYPCNNPIKKYIPAGDRVLPFPFFPRTSAQYPHGTRSAVLIPDPGSPYIAWHTPLHR